jgi:hypothetical protein
MGEGAGMDTGSPRGDTQRVTIAEAARLLGVKEPAIRKRIQRGTLEHDKGEDGRTYVYLDAGIPVGMDTGIPEPATGQEERIEELKDQITYLRDQLSEEREARRRADTIIAQLSQANAALAPRVPELESPESAGEAFDTTEPRSGEPTPTEPAEGSHEAAQERISWVALFFNLLPAALVIGFLFLVVVFASYYLFLDATLVVGIIGVVGTLGAAWLTVYLIRIARRTR